eukprot:5657678-Pyramimonas_sp.AAC.1
MWIKEKGKDVVDGAAHPEDDDVEDVEPSEASHNWTKGKGRFVGRRVRAYFNHYGYSPGTIESCAPELFSYKVKSQTLAKQAANCCNDVISTHGRAASGPSRPA